MNPNNHTKMYWDGYKDALNGYPIETNPYRLKRESESYERGHWSGQRELARRKAVGLALAISAIANAEVKA